MKNEQLQQLKTAAQEVKRLGFQYVEVTSETILSLIALVEAEQAKPQPVGELPPLPEPEIEGTVYHQEHKICYTAPVHFTAEQMQAYARAAQLAGPNKELAHKNKIISQHNQPMIGRLLDQFSALPILWGLGEPGALVRHGQVFDMLVSIGKEYSTESSDGELSE